jgi:hypothetical protein
MINKIKIVLFCVTIAFGVVIVQPTTVSAADPPDGWTRFNECSSINKPSFLEFPPWNRGLKCDQKDDDPSQISTVIESIPTFVWTVALNALDILLRIAGILAVVMLIVNGYQYLTSAGAPEKISKAKTGLLKAVVGLAIAVLSSTIIYFIVDLVVSRS